MCLLEVYDSLDGHENVSIDMVAYSGSVRDQYMVEVSEDGMFLEVLFKVPRLLTSSTWIHQSDPNATPDCSRVMRFHRMISELHQGQGPGEALTITKRIPLPFKCSRRKLVDRLISFPGIDDTTTFQLLVVQLKSLNLVHRVESQQDHQVIRANNPQANHRIPNPRYFQNVMDEDEDL